MHIVRHDWIDELFCHGAFGTLAQLTLTSVNLTKLEGSLHPCKFHYQPDSSDYERPLGVVQYAPFRWMALQSYKL